MYQPPDPEAFNTLVWELARQIPEGYVSTYGQIASMIPPPDGVDLLTYRRLRALWVGRSMSALPDGSDVPWHRVIGGKGSISLPPGSAAAEEQRFRLAAEQVQFDVQGRVDFRLVGWDGPHDHWLAARGLLPPQSLKPDKPEAPDQPRLF
ncbi:MAG: MGMT family protein [Anaerolineae bacterium]|nr:MGMT family protein [Anaerolineae bacterium]